MTLYKVVGVQLKHNITFLEFNYDCDHAHILFSTHPNSALSKYINAFKSA